MHLTSACEKYDRFQLRQRHFTCGCDFKAYPAPGTLHDAAVGERPVL
ncbi:hypothetical protein PANA5342_1325 [Pantoea ananatis LMG 5342]|nr:hypothetical protein PANA5342_1325 [Pantoea ananatis LMG 5342]